MPSVPLWLTFLSILHTSASVLPSAAAPSIFPCVLPLGGSFLVPAFRLRRADLRDLSALQTLSDELTLFDRGYDPTLTAGWPWTEAGAAYLHGAITGHEGGAAWVAEDPAGRIVGIGTALVAPGPAHREAMLVAELETVWVEPAVRGGGVGRLLVQAFLEWAEENGAARCSVRVSADNAAALAFYGRLGFEGYDVILERPVGRRE